MSKATFAPDTFAGKTFACGTLGGVGVAPPVPVPPETSSGGGDGMGGAKRRKRKPQAIVIRGDVTAPAALVSGVVVIGDPPAPAPMRRHQDAFTLQLLGVI